mgnify:CR=1 FL=1|tara:strand:- start:3642 stop:3764 length:123 start_codon:yes stop_codon:yes gene_type:complete
MDKWESIQEDVKDQYSYIEEDEEEDEIDTLLKERWANASS